MATVLSVPTANSFTFKLAGRDVATAKVFGWTALENAAIEDNAEGSVMEGIVLHRTGAITFTNSSWWTMTSMWDSTFTCHAPSNGSHGTE